MISRLSFALALAVASATASGASVDSSIQAEVSVSGQCVITAPQTLAFGDYDQTGANRLVGIQISSSLQVQCTKGTNSVVVYLDKGLNDMGSGCSSSLRRMRGTGASNANAYMAYTIAYGPAGEPDSWGCSPGSGVTNGGVETGAFIDGMTPKSLPVYGFISSGLTQQAGSVAMGDYSDTINFFVNF